MKKIKLICSFVIFFLCAGVLSACGATKIKVEFNKDSLTMNINQEIDLSELVNITGGNIGDVTFKTSDAAVVYITPSNKLVSRSAGVSIISAEGYVDAYIEVTVEKTEMKFSAPSNVAYDETKNAIVWDAVYAGNTVATSYEVTISKNGGEKETKVVNKNSIEVFGAGTYSVNVACMEKDGIQKSDATQDYQFSILSAPTNLIYNDATQMLTWEAEESATAFRVYVNGVSSEILTTKEYKLNLAEAKKYDISVMTCAAQNQVNVFGATSKENIALTRLAAPDLKIEAGVISWEDINAEKFNIKIVGTKTETETILKNGAGKYSFALTGKDAGIYNVSIEAVGNSENNEYKAGEHYLNSVASTINGIEKLHTTQLAFDKNTNTIRVVDFEYDKNYLITVAFNGQIILKDIAVSPDGTYVYDFSSEGEYKFTLTNAATTNNEINSDVSGVLTVVKLGQVSVVNHEIKDNKYYVEDFETQHATEYEVRVYLNDDTVGVSLTDENNDIGSLFNDAGTYSVSVIAKGTDNVNEKVYYLDSITNTKLSVIRLGEVEPTLEEDYKRVTWEEVSSLGTIRYQYEIVGKEGVITLNTNKLDYSGFGVGAYTAKIWATVSEQIGTQQIVLDSKDKADVAFVVDETLAKPVVSWSFGSGENEGKYYLNINSVTNATHYIVSYGNNIEPLKVEKANADSTLVEITNYVSDAGMYEFIVKAVNEGEELSDYYKDSPESEKLTAVRLESPELIDNENKTIGWESVYNNADIVYYYQIGQSVETYSTKELWLNYSSLAAGKHTITVWADCGASQAGNKGILLPSEKNTIDVEIFKQLNSPALKWGDNKNEPTIVITPVENASKYNIYLNDEETPFKEVELTEVDVSEMVANPGNYAFKVEAVGINQYYTTSNKSMLSAVRLEKLKNVNSDADQITWDAVTVANNVVYYYQIDDGEVKETKNTYFNYSQLSIGKHSISLWVGTKAKAGQTLILDSEKTSYTFEVYKQLLQPEVSFEVVDGCVYLKIQQVENVDAHLVYMYESEEAIDVEETTQDGYIYIDITNQVIATGEYLFRVKAVSENQYYQPSAEACVTVVRLEDCVLENSSDNKIIWDYTSKYNVNYGYKIVGPQGVDEEYPNNSSGVLTTKEYNYSQLEAGRYVITVWVKDGGSNGNDVLILDSAEKTAEFEVRKTIETPTVELIKGENEGNVTYTLYISNPKGAASFNISYNTEATVNISAGDVGAKTAYDITSIISTNPEVDAFTFNIVPKGTPGGFYDNDGVSAKYYVNRIETPTKFNVNNKEEFSSAISQPYYKSTEVLIKSNLDLDFVLSNKLSSDANEFTVKVKYFAKNDGSNNTYYLDSNYAEFTFKRISATLSVNNPYVYWNTDETTQTFAPKLVAYVNGQETQIPAQMINDNSLNVADLVNKYSSANNIMISLSMMASAFNESDSSELYYLSSKEVSFNLASAREDNIGLSVTEDAGLVTINWTAASEAEYRLNSENITQFNSSNFEGDAEHTYTLEERKNNVLSIYVFTIARVKNVEEIEIDEEENISHHGTLPTGAENMVSTINGETVQVLSGVTSSEAVSLNVYYKSQNSNAYKYYLDSNQSIFTFKRLQNISNSNLGVYNNTLTWDLEEDKTEIKNITEYNYNVIFTNNQNETIEELIKVKDNHIVDFAESKYSNIIYSGYTKVRVQKVIGAFVASPNSEGYYYLSDTQATDLALKILNAPDIINIKAEDLDYKQKDITIHWDWSDANKNPNDYNIDKFVIQIMYAGSVYEEYETTQSFIQISDESCFSDPGVWGVNVKVVGTADTISSTFGEESSIERLTAVRNGKITADGVISWQEVSGAVGYVIEINYIKDSAQFIKKIVSNIEEQEANGAEIVEFTKDNNFYSCSILKETESELFAGDVNATIYAVGTGKVSSAGSTLTSTRTYRFNRLKAVDVSLTRNTLTINNYTDYTNAETIIIEPSIGGEKLDGYRISGDKLVKDSGVWKYPQFTKDGEAYEFKQQTQIDFDIYVTTTNSNTMTSNTVEFLVVKLGNVTDLRFVRESNAIFFKVNNANTEGRTNVNLYGAGGITSAIDAPNNNMSIEMTEAVLDGIGSDWEFTAYAVGETISGVTYIDGEKSTISGKTLESVRSIFVDSTHTQVMWSVSQYKENIDAECGPTSYEVVVYNAEGTQIKVLNKTLDQAYELMNNYPAGKYSFAIKALGNVTSDAIYENIVLDSIYSAEQSIKKLSNDLQVNVNNGFFTLTEVADRELVAHEYVAVLFDTVDGEAKAEYVLTASAGSDIYQNAGIIETLLDYKDHYIRFYAKTTEENYISSSYAQINSLNNYLKIRLFAQEDNVITLTHGKMGTETNYAITYATFKINPAVESGIVLNINGVTTTINHEDLKPEMLDADGDWDAGTYTIKYAQYGTSGVNSETTYLTNYGNPIYVTKLAAPKLEVKQHNSFIQLNYSEGSVALSENYLTFNRVEDSNVYYLYNDSNVIKAFDKEVSEIDLSNIPHGVYSTLAMKSVSKKLGVLASKLAYLEDEEGNSLAIEKLAPREVALKDGAFGTAMLGNVGYIDIILRGEEPGILDLFDTPTGDYAELLNVVLSNAMLDAASLNNRVLQLQFKNPKTGVVVKQIYMTLMELFIGDISYQDYSTDGFPTLNRGFLDKMQDLPGGEYKLSFRVMGSYNVDKTYMMSSDFCAEKTIYISPAPKITITNHSTIENKFSDDEYILSFNNVLVNHAYFGSSAALQYQLVGITDSGERHIIATKSPTEINDSGEIIQFNLSELALSQTYKYLRVFIKGGNGSSALINGKFSNAIEIKALQKVEAFVEHGVIKWYAQEGASRYIIKYRSVDSSIDAENVILFSEGKSVYEWATSELNENVEYTVSIMAYGTLNDSNEMVSQLILSGPLTPIGTVTKLSTIKNSGINEMAIENGLFKWEKVANAQSYDVSINNSEVTDGNYEHYNQVIDCSREANFIKYETTVNDTNTHYYYFRAVGSDIESLNESSVIYVNSNVSQVQVSRRNSSISNIRLIDGYLTWESTSNGVFFRLTFTKGETSIEINTDATFIKDPNKGYYELDLNSDSRLKQAGEYSVAIQEYYADKASTNSNESEFYVISSPVVKEFYKLEMVENVTIKQGVISWEYNGKDINDYFFRLVFEYTWNGETISKTIDVSKDENNQYSEAVFDSIGSDIERETISMKIFVVPGKSNDKDVTSAAYEYNNPITQVRDIAASADDITITITAEHQLKIAWQPIEDCEYEIRYWTSKDGTETLIPARITQPYYIWEEDSYNINDGYVLYVQIRAIPLTDNYLRSAWTAEKAIEKPKTVEGLVYNTTTRMYSWKEYETANAADFQYSIRYETGNVDENGEFVVEKGYVFATENSKDTEFTPFELGKHRVSVAVKVISGDSELMSDYVVCAYDDGAEYADTTDLFESGDGMRQETAYKVSSPEQFSNMKYRLSKDLNKTILREYRIINGEENNLEQDNYTYTKTKSYYFVQTKHLEITNQHALLDYQDAGNSIEFNGYYDGDFYSLTLIWNETIDEKVSKISLFDTIGSDGSLSNINLFVKLGEEGNSISIQQQIEIAGLALTNYGKISNIKVGNVGETITISGIINELQFAYITQTNRGEIEGVKNCYNTAIYADEQNYHNARISFGAIAVNNSNKLSEVINIGNINFTASFVYAGGIVANSSTGSTITEAANIGNMDVYIYYTTGISEGVSIGGIIGTASGATINNCYVVSNMYVHTVKGADVSVIYAGGLVANMDGGSIKYSYSNIDVSIAEGSTSGIVTVYQLAGLVTAITQNNNEIYVFHKSNNSNVVNGMELGYRREYSSVVDGVNDDTNILVIDGKFSKEVTHNGNIGLGWEATFEKIEWKEIPTEPQE